MKEGEIKRHESKEWSARWPTLRVSRVPCTVLYFNFTFRVLALSPRRIPMVKESLSPNF